MKTTTELMLELWTEARTRFTQQLDGLTPEDLRKKLSPAQNSVGFLLRHMGDVELLFAKNVFGDPEVKVSAKTVIDGYDTGRWTHLQELKDYVKFSFDTLYSIVATQTQADWETVITTKEFGTKTKAEAFGRIVSHTAYHTGQMALIHKYGSA